MAKLTPSDTRAIVVGIDEYPGRWRLAGAGEDAIRMIEWLCVKRGVPRKNVTAFLGAEVAKRVPEIQCLPPTTVAIRDYIVQDLKKCTEPVLFVYWAGHGVFGDKDNRQLVCADAKKDDIKNLSLTEIADYLRGSALEKKAFIEQIIFVDACATFAELVAGIGGPTMTFDSSDRVTSKKQFTLFASRPGEPADESVRQRAGVFTTALLSELDANGNEAWPPAIEVIADSLVATFNARRAAGAVRQCPCFMIGQSWRKQERVEYGALPRNEAMIARHEASLHPPIHVNLTAAQKGAIEDALIEYGVGKDPALRAQLLDELGGVSHSDPLLELRSVVDACTRIPRGFEVLLDGLEAFGLGVPVPVTNALDSVLKRTIPWGQRQPLLAILADAKVDDTDAQNAFNVIVADRSVQRPSRATLSTCIDTLMALGMASSDASHPLFGFLQLLQPQLDTRVRKKVEAWERTVAGIVGTRVVQLRRHKRSTLAAAPVIQVQIQRIISVSDPRYHIRAWLWRRGNAGHAEQVDFIVPAEGLSRADLQTNAPQLVRVALAKVTGSAAGLRIEFILPISLLDLQVDTWTVAVGVRREPIGIHYDVVLRSKERLFREADFELLQGLVARKWGDIGPQVEPDHVTWGINSSDYSAEFFDDMSQRRNALIALTTQPADGDCAEHVFQQIVSGGLPLAVWLRSHAGDAAAARADLESRFVDVAPEDWPSIARTFRVDAAAPAFGMCEGLSILWDNPHHLPPSSEFTQEAPESIP